MGLLFGNGFIMQAFYLGGIEEEGRPQLLAHQDHACIRNVTGEGELHVCF